MAQHLITKEKFMKDPVESLGLEAECENCGGDMELFEVVVQPQSEEPENRKFFKATCAKCDAHYLVGKKSIVRSLRADL